MRTFFGVAALALAMIAIVVPHNGLHLSLAALALGAVAALAGAKSFAAATPVVAAVNLFFLSPSTLEAINRSTDVLMMWVLVVVALALPFIAIALNSSGAFDFSERKGHH